uniref:Uncharacterized protein n=1 Tax=Avena sativa TaxID=4498 RepID=A0ACD5V306_AVESA
MARVLISKYPVANVRPPAGQVTATGSEIIYLSAYDRIFAGPVTAFFVFKNPIRDPAESVRRGLSRALVHYYPMAGRLVVAGAGAGEEEVVIQCTGEGVPFVAASADCAIKDVPELCDPPVQEELALYPPSCSHSEPLMFMQVTVFSCGGFIVGITWNHLLCDGAGLVQFFQAVGELARGLKSPSVVPVRQAADCLELGLPPFSTKFMQFVATLQPSPARAFLNITVPSTFINHIKHMFSASQGRPCSVFEVVAAVLWRCRTRAILSDQGALVALFFMANARKYARAREGFYGNCVTIHLVTATSGMVANGNIMDIVKMIQRAKNEVVPDQPNMDELQQRLLGYNLLGLSSWRNFGVGFDFGAGGPARLMSYEQERAGLPFCAVCLPCEDDHNVMARCVMEEHANAFLQEILNIQLI